MSEDRVLLSGEVSGPALVLDEPISLWGGLDPVTGEIIDRRHPQHGASTTGTVLVMPVGRGSSSSASVLAEAIRAGTGPVAVVLAEPDDIVLLGALAAEEMYDLTCPIVVASAATYAAFETGATVRVDGDRLVVESA